jgi:hypothetical protein
VTLQSKATPTLIVVLRNNKFVPPLAVGTQSFSLLSKDIKIFF